jgi:dihydropteroate synthase
VSVDTMRAATAEAAVDAGAEIINDVSAGLADEAMARIAADSGATDVAMHWRGHSDRLDDHAEYDDVAGAVGGELARRVDELVASGVSPDRLILDPGLGFAKRAEQNWELLANLDVLAELGLPILVGASRKRFLGALVAEGAPVEDRDLPTAVISVLAAQAGAWGVRVHDVAGTRVALDVARAWQSGRRGHQS